MEGHLSNTAAKVKPSKVPITTEEMMILP